MMWLPDFEAIARQELQSLALTGCEVRVVNDPRAVTGIVLIKDKLRVDFWYEPYGPPWCDVARAGRGGRAVEGSTKRFAEGSPSPAAQRLANGAESPELRQEHEREIRESCARVLVELRESRALV